MFIFAACGLAFPPIAGCAGPKADENRGEASSLVYSPSARLPAQEVSNNDTGGSAAPAGVEDPVRPPAGRACKVHLRREALGVAGQVPYPLEGNRITTDRVQLTGTLERVGRDWLVLRSDRSTFWIPRDAVLAVEFDDK